MTLTLTATSWPFAVQVTDRLLTTPPRGEPYDWDANKNIILHARDGVAALAYSGIAYLDGIPTDQWIVETITTENWGRGDARPSLIGGPPKRLPKLGHAIRLVGEALSERCRRDPKGVGRGRFELIAVGYQAAYPHYPFRPVTLAFVKEENDSVGSYATGTRWLRHPAFQMGLSPATNAPFVAFEELKAATRSCASPAELVNHYVKAIQAAAQCTTLIGGDCMSIEIDCPSHPKPEVRVHFVPRNDRPVNPRDRTPTVAESRAFSPWIVGPNQSVAPSICSIEGWMSYPLGRYDVKIRGVDVMGPETVLFFGTQRRPPFPKSGPAEPTSPNLMEIIRRELRKAGLPK